MARHDWLPTREQDLADLCQRWKAVLEGEGNQAKFGWDVHDCLDLLQAVKAFLQAREAYEANRTPENRLRKDKAEKEVITLMRGFANSSVRYNKKMDDADRLPLGIRPEDSTRTTHEAPASQPLTVVENTHNHFEHKVIAYNPATEKHDKPDDAYGVCYALQVGGAEPASGGDILKTEFSRKTHFIVQHKEADKGKTAYYAVCYENGKGKKGPWSPVVQAVIG
jgi:hypothetical protein